MILTYILVVVGAIPMLVLYFAMIKHRHFRILLQYLKISGIMWAIVFAIVMMVNYHYWSNYRMPFFPIWTEIKIIFFIVMALFIIIAICSVVFAFRGSINEWLSSQGKVLFVMAVFCFNLFLLVAFIMPTGEKYDYSLIVNDAEKQFEQVVATENDPIVAMLAASRQHCYSNRSCRGDEYDNLVLVKNMENQNLWVRMEIAFLNRQNEVMKVEQYGPFYVEAGEVTPVLTSEEIEHNSVWNRWTNDTKDRVANIQYRYQYRN